MNETQTRGEWLAGLAAGDKVVVQSKYHERITRVTRTTKTQVIITGINGHERKFNRTSGYEVGSGGRWHQDSLWPCTEERERKIRETERRSRALSAINDVDWIKRTTEELETVLTVLGEME